MQRVLETCLKTKRFAARGEIHELNEKKKRNCFDFAMFLLCFFVAAACISQAKSNFQTASSYLEIFVRETSEICITD